MLGHSSVDKSFQLASERVGAIHSVDVAVVDASVVDLFLGAEVLHFEEDGVRVNLLCQIVLGFLLLALGFVVEGLDGAQGFLFGQRNLTLVHFLSLECFRSLDGHFISLLALNCFTIEEFNMFDVVVVQFEPLILHTAVCLILFQFDIRGFGFRHAI